MSKDLFDEIKEKINDRLKDADASIGKDEIVCIIDRSGSMWGIKDDAAGGLNAFVAEQAKIGEAKLTIVEFDDSTNIVCDRIDINEAVDYTLKPGGSTALLDAIGSVVGNNLKYNAPEGKTIVVIITDGGENASHEWTRDSIFEMIEERKKDGWEFLFLASNQDAIKTGAMYGFDSNQTVSFANDAGGIKAAHDMVNVYTATTRTFSKDAAMDMKKQFVDMNAADLSEVGAVVDKTTTS